MNPLVAPLALLALVFYFYLPAGKPFRALGWAALAILAVMVLQRAKPYYFAPALTILFTGGASSPSSGLTKHPSFR